MSARLARDHKFAAAKFGRRRSFDAQNLLDDLSRECCPPFAAARVAPHHDAQEQRELPISRAVERVLPSL
jgi:hypothetical protein